MSCDHSPRIVAPGQYECSLCSAAIEPHWLPLGELALLRHSLETRRGQLRRLESVLAQSELLARLFHEAYERLAPDFGYRTRQESAVPWADVPETNRRLMISICASVVVQILLAAKQQGHFS